MTRFLNLSHAMTINTGLNGITPAATLRFFFVIAANSYWDKVVIPAALDLWIWALFLLWEVFFAYVVTRCYFSLLFLRVLTPGDQAFCSGG